MTGSDAYDVAARNLSLTDDEVVITSGYQSSSDVANDLLRSGQGDLSTAPVMQQAATTTCAVRLADLPNAAPEWSSERELLLQRGLSFHVRSDEIRTVNGTNVRVLTVQADAVTAENDSTSVPAP